MIKLAIQIDKEGTAQVKFEGATDSVGVALLLAEMELLKAILIEGTRKIRDKTGDNQIYIGDKPPGED